MKRWLLTFELLASLVVLTNFANAQGRFGGGGGGGDFRGGGGSGSGSSGGSSSAHVSGPSSAPSVSHAPVVSQPSVVSHPPVVVSRPFNPGNGSSLPSVNVPSHPRSAVQFQTPVNPNPSVQRESREDFLGFRGEPNGARSVPPNRSFSPNQSAVNRFVNPNVPSSAGNPNPQVRFQGNVPRTVIPNIPRKQVALARTLPVAQQQAAAVKFAEATKNWQNASATQIDAFRANRLAHWNQIKQPVGGAAWFQQSKTPQYKQWYHAAWDYRRARAQEIWLHSHDLHDSLFNRQWWASVPWRTRPWGINAYASPWWWWRSSNWADESAFFNGDLGDQPLAYDPGMNVFYDDNGYDVDGQDLETAADAREQADSLANAPVDEMPVPEPAPDGQPEQWLPLGTWALTQQEQGDPVVYFQISVDRNGIVGGAYKNALTNEQQPIIGRLDKRQQRLAWHVPSSPQTVFETGLSSLDYDVANVFVHFGTSQTQTWLLVRLPSPENPPDSVDVPDQPD